MPLYPNSLIPVSFYNWGKYLSETRIKSSILEVSNEQQREIDKAIEEYNKRMENQLLVKYF